MVAGGHFRSHFSPQYFNKKGTSNQCWIRFSPKSIGSFLFSWSMAASDMNLIGTKCLPSAILILANNDWVLPLWFINGCVKFILDMGIGVTVKSCPNPWCAAATETIISPKSLIVWNIRWVSATAWSCMLRKIVYTRAIFNMVKGHVSQFWSPAYFSVQTLGVVFSGGYYLCNWKLFG